MSINNSASSVIDANEISEIVSDLMEAVAVQQAKLGLTDVEVGKRADVNRATVSRSKTDGDPRLSNFVALSLAVGLTPSHAKDGDANPFDNRKAVHRGLSYVRTKNPDEERDTVRERCLANSWERENLDKMSSPSVLSQLVPGFDQAEATAAATVVQWLGSQVGFEFLRQTLADAGYDIVDTKSDAKTKTKPAKKS